MSVSSIGYVHIGSQNPGEWLEFGTQILGMMEAPGQPGDDNIYLRCDERPFRFAIVPCSENKLLSCGLEMRDKNSFDEVCRSLTRAHIDFEKGSQAELSQRHVSGLVKLKDPAGNSIELYHGAKLDYLKFVSPQGIPAFETGLNGSAGFGHAVLPAPNREETHDFYTRILGLGDTDYMHFALSSEPDDEGFGLNFLHVNNPRHHSLALFEGESPAGCIHLMLEVESVDEVGYCLDRVQAKEIPVVSTLGRHTNDRMLSFYIMTPGGFPLEFGCEGLLMDWSGYTPTVSATPSIWGHKWGG